MNILDCGTGVSVSASSLQEVLGVLRGLGPETVVAILGPNVVTVGDPRTLGPNEIAMCSAPSLGFIRDLVSDASDSLIPEYPTLIESFVWWKQRWSEVGTSSKSSRVDSSAVVGRARSLAVVLAVLDAMGTKSMRGVWRWYATIGQHLRIARASAMPTVTVDDTICASIPTPSDLHRGFRVSGKTLVSKSGACPVFVSVGFDPNTVYDFLGVTRQPHSRPESGRGVYRVVLFPFVCLVALAFIVSLIRNK